jgi:hypothetical protein
VSSSKRVVFEQAVCYRVGLGEAGMFFEASFVECNDMALPIWQSLRLHDESVRPCNIELSLIRRVYMATRRSTDA